MSRDRSAFGRRLAWKISIILPIAGLAIWAAGVAYLNANRPMAPNPELNFTQAIKLLKGVVYVTPIEVYIVHYLGILSIIAFGLAALIRALLDKHK
jgi:hypothetical protein